MKRTKRMSDIRIIMVLIYLSEVGNETLKSGAMLLRQILSKSTYLEGGIYVGENGNSMKINKWSKI